MDVWCDAVSGELHATFVDSIPTGVMCCRSSHSRWHAGGLARWIPSAQTTCPSPTVRDQGATHRHAMTQPPSARTFPHQQAKKSLQNQHVLSFNRLIRASRRRGERRSRREQRAGRKAPRPETARSQRKRAPAPKRREQRAGRKAPTPRRSTSATQTGAAHHRCAAPAFELDHSPLGGRTWPGTSMVARKPLTSLRRSFSPQGTPRQLRAP